jgi:hypothetical protein
MKYRLGLTIIFLVAQPVSAESCHHFTKWNYPYPQKCYANKYIAQVVKHGFKIKPIITPTSLQKPPPSHQLQWSKYHNMTEIDIPLNIVCSNTMPEREYGLCLLRIEMEKQNEGKTNK